MSIACRDADIHRGDTSGRALQLRAVLPIARDRLELDRDRVFLGDVDNPIDELVVRDHASVEDKYARAVSKPLLGQGGRGHERKVGGDPDLEVDDDIRVQALLDDRSPSQANLFLDGRRHLYLIGMGAELAKRFG